MPAHARTPRKKWKKCSSTKCPALVLGNVYAPSLLSPILQSRQARTTLGRFKSRYRWLCLRPLVALGNRGVGAVLATNLIRRQIQWSRGSPVVVAKPSEQVEPLQVVADLCLRSGRE